MTDESAKALAEAMNRLAAAIERSVGMGATGGGIHIYHHGMHQPQYPSAPTYSPMQPNFWPATTWGATCSNTNGGRG